MASTRSTFIRSRVQLAVGDPSGIGTATASMVYYCVNRVINRICEEASAIEAKMTVSIVANTELYNFPDGFIAERVVLPNSSTPLVFKTIDEVIVLKQAGTTIPNPTGDALYYYKWNNQIGFLNASGTAPTTAVDVYLYGWRIPKSDGSEDASDSVDPLVNTRWDFCLELGAAYLITGTIENLNKYEAEFQRRRSLETSAKAQPYKIPYNLDNT